MHWTVAAPFTIDADADRWLVPFVPGDRHRFSMVEVNAPRSWHNRSHRAAEIGDWASTWSQGTAAWRSSTGGVITVFPQLAFVVGLRKRFGTRNKPVLAWCFNLGARYGGVKHAAAQVVLRTIDRIVVHSRAETHRYSEWLGIPIDRFRFVPLQRASIPREATEDAQDPFVLAMGSARRDYKTLFEVVRRSQYRTVVVAARHALEGLEIPPNVEVLSSLTEQECHRLAQRARVNVVPVLNDDTASGQVTLIEAMRMGRGVVATRCLGSEDYVQHEVTGLLVAPRSVEELRDAIDRLWEDTALRERLGREAERFTVENCSDEAAGAALGRLLDELETDAADRG